ncbi:hypothetical protein PRIPAC_73222 [Pristionchus pacificus]|uniref:Uncharacterized protein n=1 Tax=Pristionchus pacificus TaxID=54126 RepID=A0A2A6CFK4_PRIPA|nr:hypothetical protein PRIPAC_73222 [Pristionchus pacificus]|eukprot:PDM76791.1 hypothetical protein PRIPAC_42186 [Pristionchus pacificus]
MQSGGSCHHIIMLIIAFLLLLFDRNFLVHVIARRLSTIEGENVSHYRESLHITFTFIYLFCQLFYCLVIFYVFFSVMDYFRQRTLFTYRQRLAPTYDFITRIHSVRHSESRLRSTPDRLVIEQTLEKIEEESPSKEASPPPFPPPRSTPPSIPLAASMTQSFTAPPTAVSHSIRLSSQRRYSCQRDPSTESHSSGGMLSSAIHKIAAERQLSVPLGWAGAGPAPRTRARTLNDEYPTQPGTRRGSSDGLVERRDSQGRSQSVFTQPMSVSLIPPRAKSHDDRQQYGTHRQTGI